MTHPTRSFKGKKRTPSSVLLRAFLFSVLSCGSLFTVALSFLFSMTPVSAAPAPRHNVVTLKQRVASTQHTSKFHPGQPLSKAARTQKSALGPDGVLTLVSNAANANVGDTVTYTLGLATSGTSLPILAGVPVIITDTIPVGLNNIVVNALPSDWSIVTTALNGPATMTATYIGSYPIAPGSSLSPITLSGIVGPALAASNLVNTATASIPGDTNPLDNTATNNIAIASLLPTVTPVPSVTAAPSVTAVPSVTTVPSVTSTPTATQAPSATPVPTTPPAPDIAIIQSLQGGNGIQVGQPVVLTLNIGNLSSSGPLQPGNSVSVTDVLPLGLNRIVATGTNWFIYTTSTSGPALLTAIYTGDLPLQPGASLPPITVNGVLDQNALPSLTNTASVATNGDINLLNNTVTTTLPVVPAASISTPAPDMGIVQTIQGQGNNPVQIGQVVNIVLTAGNLASGSPLSRANTVTINDVLPLGLSDITVTGDHWYTVLTSTTGPALLTAVYTGAAPLSPGQSLPPITISGIANPALGNQLINTASVSVPTDTDLSNNQVTDAAAVLPASLTTPTVP